MKQRTLIYVSKFPESVFDSQVLELLERIGETDFFSKIILLVGLPINLSKSQKDSFFDKTISNRIEVRFFKYYPAYPIVISMSSFSLKKALGDLLKLDPIIHVREEVLGELIFKALPDHKDKIIYDIRAARIEEIQEFQATNPVLKLLKIYQTKKALKSISHLSQVTAVSIDMKEYLLEYSRGTNINVIPSLAGRIFKFDEKERSRIRGILGLSDNDLLYVFSSGGNASWQNTEKTINTLVDKGFYVLNLSRKRIKTDKVFNRFVKYEEVPGYLSAADLGIIWRDPSMVNTVASPVKFSEYVCCGLPVMASDAVTMVSDFIVKNNAGKVLDKVENITREVSEKISLEERKKLSLIAQSKFGSEAISKDYIKVYEKVLGEL